MSDTPFQQNRMAQAGSPYLRQHRDGPVWWQEWNAAVLDYARRNNKPLFVSVGYATCHWCHVMAQEAFANQNIADYLNEHFVSIKVDREQRPDIDNYLMAFITTMGEQGGWPLNAFLSPDAQPFYALTYAPVKPKFGRPGFMDILRSVNKYYKEEHLPEKTFVFSGPPAADYESERLVGTLENFFDRHHGGFGAGAKFPPHCTLLFMLYRHAAGPDPRLETMIRETLDPILLGGLHDHLQGGFFRYCVDHSWQIPHFEKMLYDQAMLLWSLSLANRIFQEPIYRRAALSVLTCLKETFEENGLYVSGHDADTDHREGATYIWPYEELQDVLDEKDFAELRKAYRISPEGNFEGKNHLVRKGRHPLPGIENKLLALRKKRKQPFVDRKVVTSWNCLTGIALIHAGRYLEKPDASQRALQLFERLTDCHLINGRLMHSTFEHHTQDQLFLQDYAAMLLFATFLHEETRDQEDTIRFYLGQLNEFQRDGKWIEALTNDFIPVPAQGFDHPTPSGISLAELSKMRGRILLGENIHPCGYAQPQASDFYNIAGMLGDGLFHIIGSPEKLDFDTLPVNSMQIEAEEYSDCFQGSCRKTS
ncbi:MAG: thioredoxin domain-containing protein [Candidatus Omnitrophota bacterium]